MKLSKIDAKTLDEFVYKSNKPHFMQTSAWGKVNEKRNRIPHLLGLFDESNNLKATALLIEKKVLMYSTFYCPRGFICDYKDQTVVKEMITELKEYVKANHGLTFSMDPDIIIKKHDNEGNTIFVDEENLKLIKLIESYGGKHRGFTTSLYDTSAPRYTFRLDLNKTQEELYNGFVSSAKRLANKTNPYNIDIIKGNKDNLKDFYFVMKETAIRKKMFLEPYSFYESFFNTLYDEKMADIYLVVAYKSKLLKLFEEQLNEAQTKYVSAKLKLQQADNKNNQNAVKELEKFISSLNNKISETNELKEERNVISSQLVVRFKDMVWTIHGGNNDVLGFLRANYEIHFEIFKDAMNNGYKTFDFYGTEGVIDPNSPAYGLFVFKSQFGADYDEFIGEFDFAARPIQNAIIHKLLVIRRKLLLKKSVKENENR